jgi:hypothetical protein
MLILLSLLTANAQNVINGGLENNFAPTCEANLDSPTFEGRVPNVLSFGFQPQIDIETTGCGFHNPRTGAWTIAIASNPINNSRDGAAFALDRPLVIGDSYEIVFWTNASDDFNSQLGDVTVGLSRTGRQVDRVLDVRSAPIDSWVQHRVSFQATAPDNYITFQPSEDPNGPVWFAIDDVSIIAGTPPCPDADNDGICDADDFCTGDDASGDNDGDGVCNDSDLFLAMTAVSPGNPMTLRALNASPGSVVSFYVSIQGTGDTPCLPGACGDLDRAISIGSGVADPLGTAELTLTVPPAAANFDFLYFQVSEEIPGATTDFSEVTVRRVQ